MAEPRRALLVEDEAERVAWFRRYLFVYTFDITGDVDEAIDWLAMHPYDKLYLDHDLGTEPKVGRDVARWLCEHPHVLPDLVVIVHSVNAVSGPKIVRELRAAGRSAIWYPFNEMEHEAG